MIDKTIYERLGDNNLSEMINTFYDNVLQNPIISPLFTTDINEVKRKQKMFLTQFFGGPPLYSNEFEHPRMRMRHMPHEITSDAALEWLECMKSAVHSLAISDSLKVEIFQKFPRLAAHMVNK